jgi:CRP/FNR family transcriptional regulator
MFDADTLTVKMDRQPSAPGPVTVRALSASNWASIGLMDLVAALGEKLAQDPRVADVRFPVRRVKPGERLYRAGDRFDAIYVVRCGFFKTLRVDEAGSEQVLSFPMSGDVVGLDGVDSGRYTADVIALDTGHAAVVSFSRIAQLGREHPGVERLLYRLFSRELVREHGMICLLSTLSADSRIATFLLDLSERFARLGCSRTSFVLRMTRQEIGSYLGMQLETVSRTLSALSAAGLVAVDGKAIDLLDMKGLKSLINPEEQPAVRGLRVLRRASA